MIICYFRSSALSTIDYCEHKYFLSYVLGFDDPPRLKTEMGTVVHKVLEILSVAKLEWQNTKDNKVVVNDSEVGEITFDWEELNKIQPLTPDRVDFINKSRKAKSIYITPCKLEYGHLRRGEPVVESLIKKCYDYYVERSQNEWNHLSYRDVQNWTWMAMEFNNNAYDPRLLDILAPEGQFDFELPYDWASYQHYLGGEKMTGQLGLKGTIDLVTRLDSESLEIVDWKTGARKDWGKDVRKDQAYLENDVQLKFYYYAARKLYPEYNNIIITINFIRDGGPYTVCFDDTILPEVEQMIREKYDRIRSTELPVLRDPDYRDYQCNRLCGFYKKKVDGVPFCKHVHETIKDCGIEYVQDYMMAKGHSPDKYKAPGT